MTASETPLPIHDSLTVVESETIYQHNDWWKAVVKYYFDDNPAYTEVAVYLWHNDGEWKRKNKYVIKTADGWETDKAVINRMLEDDAPGSVGSEYPVSDYYNVADGETIFRSNGWWKAILRIDQKGSYETNEVMVYVWQERDGDWYRRQKYTVKSLKKWQKDQEAIQALVADVKSDPTDRDDTTPEEGTSTKAGSEDATDFVSVELSALGSELEKHLSWEYS